jgi:tetratricopeptide (TPR) repeat protein
MKPDAKPAVAPWFQPKSKTQLILIVGVLLAAIVGIWVGGLAWLKVKSASLPPPVIQKATALYEDRQYGEAAGLLQGSIEQIQKSYGPDSMYLVKPSDLLATVYEAMKKPADAEKVWRRSYEIRRKNLGAEHPESIGSGDKLGLCLIDEGKFAEAEPLLKKSLAHRESYFGDDNENIMKSLDHLAELYLAQKKYAEALPYADRAVKIGRSKVGLMPASYPDSQRLLGAALAGLEKYLEAIPLYDAALKGKAKQLPEAAHIPPKPGQISHGDFADLCKEYASVLRKAGREKEAKEMESKAEEILHPKGK